VVCVVYAATPGVTGYGSQALAFGAHTPARGSWVATSSGFHYTAAPQEVSRDEERGDSTPQMPNGNQDGGHFAQVSVLCVCVCARTHTHTGAMERIREREKDFAWIDLEICRMPLFTPAYCCCCCCSSSSSFSSASYSSFAPRTRTCQCSSLRSPARTFSYSLVCSFHPGSREVPLTLASWSCLQRRRRRRRVVPSR
jgi:hypothetical protein